MDCINSCFNEKIISSNQEAFIKGRWIAENTVIAQEVIHKVRSHKGKKGLMVIKIDLKKPYDHLEWRFIYKALEAWGFSSEFRWMIQSCVSSASFFLLLAKEEDQDRLHDIKVARNALGISHLMYTDNLLLMSWADPKETLIFKECLDKFCIWSGRSINADKSHILFSKSTPRADKRSIRGILGFKEIGNNAIYLGNSLVLGRNKTKEFFKLKECVKCRLEGWNKHLLSKAGKAVLIKSIIQAIPTYLMTTHLLPTGLCKDLNALVRKFWWESKPKASDYMAMKA
ncbi:hypothetical protein FEM48_Zijuj10G0132300 [Ziziphus jujuba var. spinosa]|uniref:Reverse transcriptase domain-containing protein n=1 Tax=Ziziphus jujuba var. spinosa TaxID=714518 RepID=A0A978UNK7_ZIZJJ|nr:hypothetical protein FEM48_Zijuj10G0132300 [Ziziphus jujuba var. spinosa]